MPGQLGGGIVVTFRDITDRMRVERERDRFLDLSLDMFCIAGLDGHFKHVNPAFERTLGFTSEELLAKPFVEFVHPDDRQRTLDELQNLSEGRDTVNFENRYRRKDGSYPLVQMGLSGVPTG